MWDSTVISAPSFPRNYWDKQVKDRVSLSLCNKLHLHKRYSILMQYSESLMLEGTYILNSDCYSTLNVYYFRGHAAHCVSVCF